MYSTILGKMFHASQCIFRLFLEMDGLLTLFWRFGLAVADIIIRATPACPYLAAVWSGVSPYCKTIKEIRFYCPLWKVFKSRCYNSTLFITFQFEILMLKCGGEKISKWVTRCNSLSIWRQTWNAFFINKGLWHGPKKNEKKMCAIKATYLLR